MLEQRFLAISTRVVVRKDNCDETSFYWNRGRLLIKKGLFFIFFLTAQSHANFHHITSSGAMNVPGFLRHVLKFCVIFRVIHDSGWQVLYSSLSKQVVC